MYATAYSELLRLATDGATPLQRHFEVAACAELFNVKARFSLMLFLTLQRPCKHCAEFQSAVQRPDYIRLSSPATPPCLGSHSADVRPPGRRRHRQTRLLPCWQVVTLLLHQRRLPDAVAQFRAHLARFRRPREIAGAQPGVAAAHAGWLARQYAAMAELLRGRVDVSALSADQVRARRNVSMWSLVVHVGMLLKALPCLTLSGLDEPLPLL